MIGEIDGSMIPIVTPNEDAKDRRKDKKLNWKEARLALAHQPGTVEPSYAAEFQEGVSAAGDALFECARRAGFGRDTHAHIVGDGASWIAAQVDERFGSNATYLVDFYHVCEYLAAAAATIVEQPQRLAWMDRQKSHLKTNRLVRVMKELLPHIEPPDVGDSDAPVRACHRYLSNRKDQLNYAEAIEQGLPIGSGEIESAHRYVIQRRLKLAGAWWTLDNARHMLALRVLRQNGGWHKYWQKQMAS